MVDPLDIDKTMPPSDDEHSVSVAPGATLGQYKIMKLLGRGGMGEVYEAEHTTLKRKYAIKILPPDFALNRGAVQRFETEARVMANLDHCHILDVDDFGETDGRYWLRMELVAGIDGSQLSGDGSLSAGKRVVTLQDLADAYNGSVPQEEVLEVLKQVLVGLDHAHKHGVIHRDVKPGNILLQSSEVGGDKTGKPQLKLTVKISDFGLVKLVGEEWVYEQAGLSMQETSGTEDDLDTANTMAGSSGNGSGGGMIGTYDYMSPEQRNGRVVDSRSDLYSVGVLTYRLLTGRHLMGRAKAASQVADIHPGWDRFIDSCLEENPDDRPASALAALRLLDGISLSASSCNNPVEFMMPVLPVDAESRTRLRLKQDRQDDCGPESIEGRNLSLAPMEEPASGPVPELGVWPMAHPVLKTEEEQTIVKLGIDQIVPFIFTIIVGWSLAGVLAMFLPSWIMDRVFVRFGVAMEMGWAIGGGVAGVSTVLALGRIYEEREGSWWCSLGILVGMLICALLRLKHWLWISAAAAGVVVGVGFSLMILEKVGNVGMKKMFGLTSIWIVAGLVGCALEVTIGIFSPAGVIAYWGAMGLTGSLGCLLTLRNSSPSLAAEKSDDGE